MRKTLGICLILLLCGGFFSTVLGQNWKSGIVVHSEDASSTTYQFRVVGLESPIAADRLEDALETKEGMVNAHASVVTKICKITTPKGMEPRHIADVVRLYGFEIEKSFEEQ